MGIQVPQETLRRAVAAQEEVLQLLEAEQKRTAQTQRELQLLGGVLKHARGQLRNEARK